MTDQYQMPNVNMEFSEHIQLYSTMGLNRGGTFVSSELCTVCTVYIVPTVYIVYTVYIVPTVYIVYTVYIVPTVYIVHTVYIVYCVFCVLVYSVYTLFCVYCAYSLYSVTHSEHLVTDGVHKQYFFENISLQ